MDRLDIHVEMPPVEYGELSAAPGEASSRIRQRVEAARARQRERYDSLGVPVSCNARLDSAGLRRYCQMTPEGERMLHAAYDRLGLSGRSYDRILRVSRTIADLAGEDSISADAVAEAVQYRNLDRKYWQPDLRDL